MQKVRRILGNLNVINILLAAVLLLFLSYGVLPMLGGNVRISVPAAKKQPAAAPAAAKPEESKTPSPADYVVIAEQNLFHPERKIPVDKKDAAAPLPKPEFVLYGTLLTDDLHIAYMEDRKAPQNSPSRGKKQIPVKLGEPLSGFTLKEIDADKVVMARGEEKIVVYLNDATMPKERGTAAPAAAPAAAARPMPAGRTAQGQEQPPGVAGPAPAGPAQSQPTAAARQSAPLAGKENAVNKFLDVFRAQRGMPATNPQK